MQLTDNIIIVSGLDLTYPNGGVGSNLSSVVIEAGMITFNNSVKINYGNWSYKNHYKSLQNYTISLPSNGGNYQKLIAIYALPDYLTKYDVDTYGMVFSIQEGIPAVNPQLPILSDGSLLLGLVLLPGMFPSGTPYTFRSLNISRNETNFALSLEDYYNKIVKTVEEWYPQNLYFENQVIRYDNTLWYCTNTHSSYIFTNDKEYFWTKLSSSGGGGSTDCVTVQDCMYLQNTETISGKQYIVTYLKLPDNTYEIVKTKQI